MSPRRRQRRDLLEVLDRLWVEQINDTGHQPAELLVTERNYRELEDLRRKDARGMRAGGRRGKDEPPRRGLVFFEAAHGCLSYRGTLVRMGPANFYRRASGLPHWRPIPGAERARD